MRVESFFYPYNVILHSLTHDDNKSYENHHIIILEKWCRDFSNGLLIKNIVEIVNILVELHKKGNRNPKAFRDVIKAILINLLTKPLFETKVNERFRPNVIVGIQCYYKSIFAFYHTNISSTIQIDVISTFISILRSTTESQIDIQKSLSYKTSNITSMYENSKAIKDKNYIVKQLIDSGLIHDFILEMYQIISFISQNKDMIQSSLFQSNDVSYSTTMKFTGTQQDYDDDENNIDDDWNVEDIISMNTTTQQETNENKSIYNKTRLSQLQNHYRILLVWIQLFNELTTIDPTTISLICCQESVCNMMIEIIDIFKCTSDSILAPTIQLLWTLLSNYKIYRDTPIQYEDSTVTTTSTDNVSTRNQDKTTTTNTLIIPLQLYYIDAINIITSALDYKLQYGSSNKDKNCRNDMVVVLTLLFQLSPIIVDDYNLQNTGINKTNYEVNDTKIDSNDNIVHDSIIIPRHTLTLLIIYTCIIEYGIPNFPLTWSYTPILSHFDTTLDIDIQFKELLLLSLSELLSHYSYILERHSDNIVTLREEILAIYEYINVETPLLSVLLEYIEQDTIGTNTMNQTSNMMNTATNKWNTGTMNNMFNMNTFTLSTTSMTRTNNLTMTQNTKYGHKSYYERISRHQILQLQLLCIKLLATHGYVMIDKFIQYDGIQKVLRMIQQHSQESSTDSKYIVYYGLMTLYNVVQSSSIARNIVYEYSGIPILLSMILDTIHESHIVIVILLCITSLCEDDTCRIQCQNNFTVDPGALYLFIQLLEQYCDYKRIMVGNYTNIPLNIQRNTNEDSILLFRDKQDYMNTCQISTVLITIFNCLHKVIMDNIEVQNLWAKNGGLDILLNILEVSPFILRIPILRILSDVIKNPLLITIFEHWKSLKTFRSSKVLLIHCWLDEEVRLGVQRSEDGIIRNFNNPLGGSASEHEVDRAKVMTPLTPVYSEFNQTVHTPIKEEIMNESRNLLEMDDDDDNNIINSQIQFYNTNEEKSVNNVQYDDPDTDDEDFDDDLNVSFNLDTSASISRNFETHPVSSKVRKLIDTVEKSRLNIDGMVSAEVCMSELNSFDARILLSNIFYIVDTYKTKSQELSSVSNIHDETYVELSLLPSLFDDKLTPIENQVIAMANRYSVMRKGIAWKVVKDSLYSQNVKPIEIDNQTIEYNIDLMLQASTITQKEQKYLYQQTNDIMMNIDKDYNQSILLQKTVEFKAAWMKKMGPTLRKSRIKKKVLAQTRHREDPVINFTQDLDSSDDEM